MRSKAEKVIIKILMSKLLNEMSDVKVRFITNQKYRKRTKIQGFNPSRDLVLSYKTHMNRVSKPKTHDYIFMTKVMQNIADWYNAETPTKGRLLFGLNHITLVLRFNETKIKLLTELKDRI